MKKSIKFYRNKTERYNDWRLTGGEPWGNSIMHARAQAVQVKALVMQLIILLSPESFPSANLIFNI